MRCTFLVVLLAACAPHITAGPAWPKTSSSTADGGESIAPHEAHQVAAAIEKSEPEAKPAAPEPKPATPALVPAGAPAATPAVSNQAAEEPMTVDDIIIEIDE